MLLSTHQSRDLPVDFIVLLLYHNSCELVPTSKTTKTFQIQTRNQGLKETVYIEMISLQTPALGHFSLLQTISSCLQWPLEDGSRAPIHHNPHIASSRHSTCQAQMTASVVLGGGGGRVEELTGQFPTTPVVIGHLTVASKMHEDKTA